MSHPSLESFTAEMKSQGFDEVVERKWAPSTVLEWHTHPFSVKALVVEGEMWLIVGDREQHLVPGDTFALDRAVRHAERYGDQGATYWAARRHSG